MINTSTPNTVIKILCVSKMPPDAPCGVVTYYQKLLKNFVGDNEISIQVATIGDASRFGKIIAGIARRLISFFAFGNKKLVKWSIDVNFEIMMFFALKRKNQGDYQLIHAQDILSGVAAKIFYQRKIPLVLTCHFNDNPVEEDVLLYGLADRQYLAKKYERKFVEVDKFIFVSRYVYQKTRYLLKDSADVEIIYNGVDFSSLVKPDRDNVLKIINVGFVEDRKNQRILIPVAKKLIVSKVHNFHITVVGDGPDLSILKKEIRESGLDDYFTFTGWISNVDEYLKTADLYIHTAKNDNCPYSLIEAISKKVPAIAFSVGGIPEIVGQEYLFELNDYDGVCDFIKRNRFALPEIGKRQYDRICKAFSIQYQTQSTKAAYISSINNFGRRLSTGRVLVNNQNLEVPAKV